jgi:hypothetical protein
MESEALSWDISSTPDDDLDRRDCPPLTMSKFALWYSRQARALSSRAACLRQITPQHRSSA